MTRSYEEIFDKMRKSWARIGGGEALIINCDHTSSQNQVVA